MADTPPKAGGPQVGFRHSDINVSHFSSHRFKTFQGRTTHTSSPPPSAASSSNTTTLSSLHFRLTAPKGRVKNSSKLRRTLSLGCEIPIPSAPDSCLVGKGHSQAASDQLDNKFVFNSESPPVSICTLKGRRRTSIYGNLWNSRHQADEASSQILNGGSGVSYVENYTDCDHGYKGKLSSAKLNFTRPLEGALAVLIVSHFSASLWCGGMLLTAFAIVTTFSSNVIAKAHKLILSENRDTSSSSSMTKNNIRTYRLRVCIAASTGLVVSIVLLGLLSVSVFRLNVQRSKEPHSIGSGNLNVGLNDPPIGHTAKPSVSQLHRNLRISFEPNDTSLRSMEVPLLSDIPSIYRNSPPASIYPIDLFSEMELSTTTFTGILGVIISTSAIVGCFSIYFTFSFFSFMSVIWPTGNNNFPRGNLLIPHPPPMHPATEIGSRVELLPKPKLYSPRGRTDIVLDSVLFIFGVSSLLLYDTAVASSCIVVSLMQPRLWHLPTMFKSGSCLNQAHWYSKVKGILCTIWKLIGLIVAISMSIWIPIDFQSPYSDTVIAMRVLMGIVSGLSVLQLVINLISILTPTATLSIKSKFGRCISRAQKKHRKLGPKNDKASCSLSRQTRDCAPPSKGYGNFGCTSQAPQQLLIDSKPCAELSATNPTNLPPCVKSHPRPTANLRLGPNKGSKYFNVPKRCASACSDSSSQFQRAVKASVYSHTFQSVRGNCHDKEHTITIDPDDDCTSDSGGSSHSSEGGRLSHHNSKPKTCLSSALLDKVDKGIGNGTSETKGKAGAADTSPQCLQPTSSLHVSSDRELSNSAMLDRFVHSPADGILISRPFRPVVFPLTPDMTAGVTKDGDCSDTVPYGETYNYKVVARQQDCRTAPPLSRLSPAESFRHRASPSAMPSLIGTLRRETMNPTPVPPGCGFHKLPAFPVYNNKSPILRLGSLDGQRTTPFLLYIQQKREEERLKAAAGLNPQKL